MRLSKGLFATNKITHEQLKKQNIDSTAYRAMQAGYIIPHFSGGLSLGTIGFRTIEKIKKIIRQNLEALGALPIYISTLQKLDDWNLTGRVKKYGNNLMKIQEDYCLAPSAEEYCIRILQNFIFSKKQLPIFVYQISYKYRNELRPRGGLLRTKEFLMKDAYSFDNNAQDALQSYTKIYNNYIKIFKELNLIDDLVIVSSKESGEIGGDFCHEFLIRAQFGESKVYYQKPFTHIDSQEANTTTILQPSDNFALENVFSKEEQYFNAVEIGNIFYLGDHYTKIFNFGYKDEQQKMQYYQMGCYGIGISRLLAVILNKFNVLPANIAPFIFYLIEIQQMELANKFYNNSKLKAEILFDDRDIHYGTKIKDGEIIGIPYIIIMGKNIELQNRLKNQTHYFNNIQELENFILPLLD